MKSTHEEPEKIGFHLGNHELNLKSQTWGHKSN